MVEEGNSLLLLCMREEEDRDVREKRCTKQRLKEGMQIAFWLFVCMLWPYNYNWKNDLNS
jgi:hypothetical protein